MIDLEKLKATIASLKQVNEHIKKCNWDLPRDVHKMMDQWKANIEGLELLEKEFTPLIQALEEAKRIMENEWATSKGPMLNAEGGQWLSRYFPHTRKDE